MTDTTTTESPILGKVKSRHIGTARGIVYNLLKKQAGEYREVSISRRKLALAVNRALKKDGFDYEDAEFAVRKALAQLVQRGMIEIIPVPPNEHGMNLPAVYRLKGQ